LIVSIHSWIQVDHADFGHLGESIQSWKKLDPEMMLFLFLPVLIFGEAMTLKWFCIIFSRKGDNILLGIMSKVDFLRPSFWQAPVLL
jgi:hypothetical protein